MSLPLIGSHQSVDCPRCQQPFACRKDTISVCQCSVLALTDEQQRFVSALYQGCLCASCLSDLQTEYTQKKESVARSGSS